MSWKARLLIAVVVLWNIAWWVYGAMVGSGKALEVLESLMLLPMNAFENSGRLVKTVAFIFGPMFGMVFMLLSMAAFIGLAFGEQFHDYVLR